MYVVLKRLNKRALINDIEYATLILNILAWILLMFVESLFMMNMYSNKGPLAVTYDIQYTTITNYLLGTCIVIKTCSVWVIVIDKTLLFVQEKYRKNRARYFVIYPAVMLLVFVILMLIQIKVKWPSPGYERCGSMYCRSNLIVPYMVNLKAYMNVITIILAIIFQQVFERTEHISFEYTAYRVSRNITFTSLSIAVELLFAYVPVIVVWLESQFIRNNSLITFNNIRLFLPQSECLCITIVYGYRFRLYRALKRCRTRIITGYGHSVTTLNTYYYDSDTMF